MKKITLVLISVLLFGVKTVKAQEQELSVSDPISSGCLTQSDSEEAPASPTIKLTKENNTLFVDLFNYVSNCGTTRFEVENKLSGGNDDTPDSLDISVVPVIPFEADCTCPFNISFTVRGLEKNKFFLTCWWYEGQVELTEGEPLVLEYKTESVVIDSLSFKLLKVSHQAMLELQRTWNKKSQILQIPSEVEYEGEKYTVSSMNESVFLSNNTIKRIIIPKTIKRTGEFGGTKEITTNPFSGCMSLEAMEVDDENLVISSVDGVLFNKEKNTLIGYPANSPWESYTVPDNVTIIGLGAFAFSKRLKRIIMPNCVETLNSGSFVGNGSLEEVMLSSNIKELPDNLFLNCIKLKTVVVPDGITTIGSSAFKGCSSLDSFLMPESIVKIGTTAFMDCSSLKRVTLSSNLKEIPLSAFKNCSKLTEVIVPYGITNISNGAFVNCVAMQSFDLPESIDYIDDFAFGGLLNLKDIYCFATIVPNTNTHAFKGTNLSQVTLHVPEASIDNYRAKSPWNQFGAIVPLEVQLAYRPVVEDGKVWKVGHVGSNPVQLVEYYYFEGDTIIDGKTCWQMMRQRFFNPEFPDYDAASRVPSLSYAGAWYEEEQKVYAFDSTSNQFKLMYDFSLADNGTFQVDGLTYVAGPRQTGGLQGFKGVYRDVRLWADGERIYSPTWLEGVGSIDGPTTNVYSRHVDPVWFLMSCTVDDEVIYLNDEFEDGATPEGAGARNRFDFTHTIKTQPKVPMRREAERPLYGEYGEQQLNINLGPLSDTYLVNITDETGKVVYEKTINASSIVGLSINISAYPKGCYTVVVENSQESFIGQFEAQTAGIEEMNLSPACAQGGGAIYNLQGQRIGSLQKGLNIVNGQKVYVR